MTIAAAAATRPRRLHGPTPVALPRLVELTRTVAAEVRAGRHPVRFDPDDRWSVRLSSDPYTDVWLISWTQEQSTELHDHAGSLGALTVVSGAVTERFWTPATAGLRERKLRDGRGVGFPVGHVHDVVNTAPEPAVTVHAYSPPLTAMGYYEVDDAGALRRVRTILTDEPEPGR
jgi:predicted metal-dependent enzyme (double-stranded beta helix superfamily)